MAAAEEEVEVVDAEVVPESESTDLVVVDRQSGEQLTVRDAPDEVLARFMLSADEWLATQRSEVEGAKNIVNAELLKRMDARLKWTQRARLGTVEFELKSSSPHAGAEAYDTDRMKKALQPLVEDGTLSQEAYEEVVKRTVTIKATGHDTGRLERFARNAHDAKVTDDVSVHLPAVAKLKKLGDERVNAAIEEAKVEARINRADRKVKVSIKSKRK